MITMASIGFVEKVIIGEFEATNYPSSASNQTRLRLRLRKFSAELKIESFAAFWEECMIRTFIMGMTAGVALTAGLAAPAFAEEAIVGTWKRPNGTIISYAACGGGKYCGTVQTGEYKGKSIGTMSGKDGSYKGEVNKLDEGKTYTGKASVKGNTLSLSGCVMGGLICKSESLARQ